MSNFRKKFIITSFLTSFATLFLMIALINIVNYYGIFKEAESKLDLMEDNIDILMTLDMEDSLWARLKEMDIMEKWNREDSDILGNNVDFDEENNYYAVTIGAGNTNASVDVCTSATLEHDELEKWVIGLYEKGKKSGLAEHHFYRALQNEDGSLTYLILDAMIDVYNAEKFMKSSMIIGMITWIIIIIPLFVVSGQQAKNIEEALDRQRRFELDANHEMRTPLAIISADIDIMEMTGGETKCTRSIRKQTKRMELMIENLILLNKQDIYKMITNAGGDNEDYLKEKEKISVNDLLERLVEGIRPYAIVENHDFYIEHKENVVIEGNLRMLRQLFMILLDNSIKYAKEDTDIYMSIASVDGHLIYTIENEAEGLEIKDYHVWFERYYRDEAVKEAGANGYGIGLAMAKAIVEVHKGSIIARSDDGKKITFTVRI